MIKVFNLKNFFCFLFLFLFMCSKGRGKLDELKVPDWVLDPYSKTIGVDSATEIAGVGMAQECGDLSVEISEAEEDARLKIALQIEVNVNAQIDSSIDKSTVTNKTELKKSFKQAVKSSVDVAIRGAMRRAIYKDTGSNNNGIEVKSTLYVLLSMARKDVIDSLKKDLSEQFKNKQQRGFVQDIN